MIAKTFCAILSIAIYAEAQHANNVCSSLEAYFNNITVNPKCWYDPDVNATPQERSQNNGFLLEEHQVTTEDGYNLPLYRLKNLDGSYGSQAIYLQHGMMTDASFLMANKKKSISYYLARKGYDVWLGNYRNEDCSHVTLTSSDPKYWGFSYHENGVYDLPANYQYIQNLTGQKIIHIGHSLGSTGLAIYASLKPIEAEKYIKHAILLAPAIHFKQTEVFLSKSTIGNLNRIMGILPAVGYNAVMKKDSFEILALKRFCYYSLDNVKLFQLALSTFLGKFVPPLEPEKIPIMLNSGRSVSFKTLKHYMQNLHSGKFRMFDYGPEENMVRYGKEIPKDYDLSQITNSVSLIYGVYDNLTSKENIVAAYQRYHKPNWEIFELPHNHLGLLLSRNARKTILPLLSKIIGKVLKNDHKHIS